MKRSRIAVEVIDLALTRITRETPSRFVKWLFELRWISECVFSATAKRAINFDDARNYYETKPDIAFGMLNGNTENTRQQYQCHHHFIPIFYVGVERLARQRILEDSFKVPISTPNTVSAFDVTPGDAVKSLIIGSFFKKRLSDLWKHKLLFGVCFLAHFLVGCIYVKLFTGKLSTASIGFFLAEALLIAHWFRSLYQVLSNLVDIRKHYDYVLLFLYYILWFLLVVIVVEDVVPICFLRFACGPQAPCFFSFMQDIPYMMICDNVAYLVFLEIGLLSFDPYGVYDDSRCCGF